MIHVTSEVKKLKKILLYRPGDELLNIVPRNMNELLFDDIPYLKIAQKEHDALSAILKNNGVEVVYLDDLLKETLDKDPACRIPFLFEFMKEAGINDRNSQEVITEHLIESSKDNRTLIRKLISGTRLNEFTREEIRHFHHPDNYERGLLLNPIPNLYFQRDPMAVIAEGISINHMHTLTRNRETLFYELIFNHHPEYKNTVKYYTRDMPYFIEGGDVLNLSEKTVGIGISERTSPEAIKELAENCFRDENCPIKEIVTFSIPKTRAFMHLDTVFTQVDLHRFVIHPSIMESLKINRMTKKENGRIEIKEVNKALESVLSEILESDKVELLPCGGGDILASEREQWNDGSNTLCIEPGKVITYDRNEVTNRYLKEQGIVVLEMPSSELSRGRGGPHCMSLPLEREE